MRAVELDLRPERFAVVKLERGAEIPWWVESSVFFSVTRTESELSIVCDETALPHSEKALRGFRCFSVRGPLGFDEVGILSSVAHPLAESGISIFTVSSFDTDYVFVADVVVDQAVRVLREAGHTVHGYVPDTTGT
ncbi:MAG: ACT domain-containing protein [Gemmatimonadota bacterium]|jgi:hypothetical protein